MTPTTATDTTATAPSLPLAVTAADLPEIQALVFRGWARNFRWASFLFVALPARDDTVDHSDRAEVVEPNVAAARAWLRAVEAQIAWAAGPSPDTLVVAGGARVPARLQLALTTKGLRRLGLPAAAIQLFPLEAKVGMERRARVLGDAIKLTPAQELDPTRVDDLPYLDANKPQPTDWTIDLRDADAMLLLFADSADDLQALVVAQRQQLAQHGGRVLVEERSAEWKEREPFGFADGVSQPVIKGQPGASAAALRDTHNVINAGEILLGYRNEYGQDPKSPVYDGVDLGRNGTFLVFRKLEQDVTGFWSAFAKLGARHLGEPVAGGTVPTEPRAAAQWLAARAMGRWTNGNSVLLCPHAAGERMPPDTINAFVYGSDPYGLTCPIGAHVRRANPRDERGGGADESWKVVRRHRILRRGRAYGEYLSPDEVMDGATSEVASGLLFVCLQANITHGFEFVQQIWNNNPGFKGLFQEPDVIAGPGGGRYTIPADPVAMRLTHPDKPVDEVPVPDPSKDPLGLPRFVTPRGGGYFFVPSRSTVAYLTRA